MIGFSKEFSFDSSYEEIPKFWDEVFEKYKAGLLAGKLPVNEIEQAVYNNRVGEFGVCIDDAGYQSEIWIPVIGKA